MIQRVTDRKTNFNNADFITKYWLFSYGKYLYYLFFSIMYRFCGAFAHTVLVNGSFTRDHIVDLWKCEPKLCYPPVCLSLYRCEKSSAESLWADSRKVNVVSLGQFRPEKNHREQLETLAILKKKHSVFLYMIGGIRNEDDEMLVRGLCDYAEGLGLKKDKDFVIVSNATNAIVKKILAKCMFALHTMVDEHFGIAVVELMSGGILTVAHKSGGPLFDIIGNENGRVGFLGENANEYAQIITEVLELRPEERNAIRSRTMRHIKQFNECSFYENMLLYTKVVLNDSLL